MARKSLNDVLSNDRSVARVAQGGSSVVSYHKDDEDWVAKIEAKYNTAPKLIDHQNDYGSFEKCYKKHPKLSLGGGTLIGGSGEFPVAQTAFAFIGFDYKVTVPAYDYEKHDPPHCIHHKIADMHAPDNPAEFIKLVKWTASKLKEGKTIHCGCIGGHGRTGTFISAVVKEITGEEDAIGWTRKHYCHKAVESTEQVDFLAKHFGITPQQGAKSSAKSSGKTQAQPKSKSVTKGNHVFSPIGPRFDIFKP
jgi:hypothetical protein